MTLMPLSRGPGGIRTHVRTRKPYAFYTLIPAFGFRAMARPGPPTITLASKISLSHRGLTKPFPKESAPLDPQVRKNTLGAMSRRINY